MQAIHTLTPNLLLVELNDNKNYLIILVAKLINVQILQIQHYYLFYWPE